MKQNFQKYKIDTGKTAYFVIGPFCTPHSSCLNIEFCIQMFLLQLKRYNFEMCYIQGKLLTAADTLKVLRQLAWRLLLRWKNALD